MAPAAQLIVEEMPLAHEQFNIPYIPAGAFYPGCYSPPSLSQESLIENRFTLVVFTAPASPFSAKSAVTSAELTEFF